MAKSPDMLVFLRHGRTIANDVYSARNKGLPVDPELEHETMNTPDWKHMLNETGIKQAEQARNWIDTNLGGVATFDGLFTSYFARSRHSAALLGDTGGTQWHIDDRLAEKNHGVYGVLTHDGRKERHLETEQMIQMSPWYAVYPGGESEAMMRERYRSFASERLDHSGLSSALIVAHAGLIGAARYHIEHLLPEEHEELERERRMPITNGSLLMYKSTADHENSPDGVSGYSERRLVYPGSYDSGWVAIDSDRTFSSDELLAQIESLNQA